MLISLDGVTKYFADRLILDNITAAISEGDKVGLVGVNGAGKTTLVDVICGAPYDEGEISRSSTLTVGYLKQDSGLQSGNTITAELYGVFEEVLEAGRRIDEINAQLSLVPHESEQFLRLSRELERTQSFFNSKDGYDIDVRINKILNGMGFENVDRNTVIDTLSGGEKTRLAIAKLLLEEPSLLILDEPTNHLDFETLSWLEGYLQTYKGALLLVSHDRYFLDRLVTRVWEIEDRKIMTFRGNYTSYKTQKAEYVERRQKEYEKQQEKVASMLDYAARNIARASTSNSAKSRLHQLENMELIEAPRTYTKPPSISFEIDVESVKEVLNVENLPLSAGDKKLCDSISFNVRRQNRIAVIGKNGCGKSTLMKKLLAAYTEREAGIAWGKNVSCAFYEQESRNLNPENTLLDEMRNRYPRMDRTVVQKYLGRVLLSGEEVFKQIKVLSGGERARLGFAVIMARRANTLLLDEPTNHIDLASREALEAALSKFEGTVIFVSHDRYLINAIATHVLAFDNGNVKMYEGGYDAYLAAKALEAPAVEVKAEKAASANEVQYYRSKKQRSEEAARKSRIAFLERRMGELENEKSEIEAQLTLPDVASDFEKATELCNRLDAIKTEYESSENEWLELSM